MERQASMPQILDATARGLRNSIYVTWPGAVVAFDAAHATVDVQPMLNDPRQDVDTGDVVTEPWQVMPAVPIAWPRFGGFVLMGPMVKNDPVILCAWDLEPAPWLAQGPSTKPVDPTDVRRLSGGYWYAIPANFFAPPKDAAAAATAMVVGVDGDQAQVRIEPGSLQLGATGGDFVALASLVKGELNNIATTLGSLTGASFSTPYSGPGNVASSLIKAQ